MAKNLVIVESPAKAKTIEKFLGPDFKVESSFGHIRDLPARDLGVDLEHDFAPKYAVSADKKDVVKKLKKLAKESLLEPDVHLPVARVLAECLSSIHSRFVTLQC